MPYPNEHAVRLESPDKYASIRRENNKLGDGIDVIWGILEDGKTEMQAIRFKKDKFNIDEVKAWIKEHDLKPIEIEEAAVNQTEEFAETFSFEKNILATGVWNDTKFEDTDLDDILTNFNELNGYRNVPCKLGHTDKQKILQEDGLPAAGWITELKKVGNKLIAKIDNVPSKIKELIENKAYRDVSVELLKNYKDKNTGKSYKWLLTAVALLGVDAPAVKGLGDFVALYGEISEDNIININFNELNSSISNATTINNIEEEKMDELEMLKKENDTLKQEIERLKKELGTEIEPKEEDMVCNPEDKKKMSELEAKIEALEAEKKNFIEEKRNKEIESIVDSYSIEGNMKVLPYQKVLFTELFKSLSDEKVLKFSENDKEENISAFDMLKKILDGMPEQVKFNEEAHVIQPEKEQKFEFEADELHAKILKIQEKEKLSYEEAYEKAIKREEI
jgi:hypothetical protein